MTSRHVRPDEILAGGFSVIDAARSGAPGNGDDDTGAFHNIIDNAPPRATIILPNDKIYTIRRGKVISKAIVILGGNIRFIPDTPNDILFNWTKTGADPSATTEEGQLDGGGLIGTRLLSNRTVRANAIKFNNVDNAVLNNVFVRGFKGFSLHLQRSREFNINGFRTRYNGYFDPVSPANSVGDVIFDSTEGFGDTTNFCEISNLFSIYSFWHCVQFLNLSNMMCSNVMIHNFPRAHTGIETNYVALFGGSPGFSGGVPRNDYAELHADVIGSESSVSGLSWDNSYLTSNRVVHASYATNVYISSFKILGGQTDYNVHAANSRLFLSNGEISSANASSGSLGFLVYASGAGSEVYLGSQSVRLDDARQAIGTDGSGQIYGVPVMGTTYSQSTALPFKLTSSAQNNAGIQICEATNEEVGFFGVPPVQQPSGSAQGEVSGTASGAYTANEQALLNNLTTLTNAIRLALVSLGVIKGSA